MSHLRYEWISPLTWSRSGRVRLFNVLSGSKLRNKIFIYKYKENLVILQ